MQVARSGGGATFAGLRSIGTVSTRSPILGSTNIVKFKCFNVLTAFANPNNKDSDVLIIEVLGHSFLIG